MNRAIIERDLLMADLNVVKERDARLQAELIEDEFYRKHLEKLEKIKYYHSAYRRLLQLNPDSFSITAAVFMVENAWYDNKYPFDGLTKRMEIEAGIIKQILKTEKLKSNDVSINYAIQKRFRQGGMFYDAKSKSNKLARPFQYDFKDITGEKEYSQMFATKMLITGKGQCHSMPLVYLMIAERVGAKSWLSMAPQHSFIKFMDQRGNLFNFEATNGNVVSSTWMHQSGYITAAALKNKVYMDTLSSRQLYAQCLSDLLLGYLDKFGYDEFADQVKEHILSLQPHNLAASIVDANVKQQIAWKHFVQAGKPAEKDLPNYPEAYRAYLAMHQAYDKIDNLGYQDMPGEAYQRWLKIAPL